MAANSSLKMITPNLVKLTERELQLKEEKERILKEEQEMRKK